VLRIRIHNGKARWADSNSEPADFFCASFEESLERHLLVLPQGEAVVAAALVSGSDVEGGTISDSTCESLVPTAVSDSLLIKGTATDSDANRGGAGGAAPVEAGATPTVEAAGTEARIEGGYPCSLRRRPCRGNAWGPEYRSPSRGHAPARNAERHRVSAGTYGRHPASFVQLVRVIRADDRTSGNEGRCQSTVKDRRRLKGSGSVPQEASRSNSHFRRAHRQVGTRPSSSGAEERRSRTRRR
jgi:hypothetical protein